jgi:hypothetical protein
MFPPKNVTLAGRDWIGSHPVRTDAGAGREPLGNRRQGCIGLIDDAVQALQSEPVDDLLAAPFGIDKATVPQASEVGADPGLGLPHGINQLADRMLPFLEQLKNVQAGRVAENAEKACGCPAIDWR